MFFGGSHFSKAPGSEKAAQIADEGAEINLEAASVLFFAMPLTSNTESGTGIRPKSNQYGF